MSDLEDVLAAGRDALTVKRVYGDPYEKDGVTFIPAAWVMGGGGGGEGEGGESMPGGAGSGFGMIARPVGAFQIKGGEVSWVPAADTTRVIILSEIVAVVALLVVRSVFRVRRSRT